MASWMELLMPDIFMKTRETYESRKIIPTCANRIGIVLTSTFWYNQFVNRLIGHFTTEKTNAQKVLLKVLVIKVYFG